MKPTVVSGVMLAILLAGCFGSSATPPPDPTALQVPTLREAPALDRKVLMGEWDDALPLQGTFSIRDGTPAAGEYPFEMRLGHNDKFLFGWIVVHQVPPNPYNGKTVPDHSDKHGYSLDIFLDTKLGASLKGWESWKDSVFIEGSTESGDGYWGGSEWVGNPESPDPIGSHWDGDRPTSGTWFRGWNESSNINWEFYIPLKAAHSHDDFTIGPGGIFRMCAFFEIQGGLSPDQIDKLFTAPHDTYPGDGYTPNGYLDPTTWMRLQLA